MRTSPAIDRSKIVIATGGGLFVRFSYLAMGIGLFFGLIWLLTAYWYVVLTVIVLILGFWLPYRVRKAEQAEARAAARHRAKYGTEPRPW